MDDLVYGKAVDAGQAEIVESQDKKGKEGTACSEKDQEKAMPTDSKSAMEDKC